MGTVVLVRQGDKFSPRYVELLTEQVKQHFGYRVVTLTDQTDTPGHTLPLLSGLTGWWAKLELFAPWNEKIRPFVFFDLDTYILQDIRDFVPGEELLMLRDFYRNAPASGVMFVPKKTEVWNKWDGNTNYKRGDGEYIGKFCKGYLQDRYRGIFSYKADLLPLTPPDESVRIVCFHGLPKPPDTDGWSGEIWNSTKKN